MKKVIIIGAGPAGITAGYDLLSKSSDYEVTIVEEASVVGGLCARHENEENVLDAGGHMFISNNAAVKRFWNSILPPQGVPSKDDLYLDRYCKISNGGPNPAEIEDVLLSREKITRFYKDTKFYENPIRFNKENVKNIGFATSIKSGFSKIGGNVFNHKENSLEDYYVNRIGKQLYSMFLEEYLEKVWGKKPSQMGSEFGAISEKNNFTPCVTTEKGVKDYEKANATNAARYYYPKYGAYQMWEAAADRFIEMGGSIHKNCKVTSITTNQNRITSVKCSADGDEFVVRCDYLISSMPIRDLIMGMDNVDYNVKLVAENLSYRGLVSVLVELTDMVWKNDIEDMKTIDDIVPDSFIYINNPNVKVSRIQVYNNFSPYMIRNTAHFYLGLNYYCNEGDYYWSMNNRDWQKTVESDLMKLGIIGDVNSIVGFNKVKYNKAFPAYYDGYENLDLIKAFLNRFDNLYCIGRNGQHRFSNIDESMKTSFEAVKNILGYVRTKENIWNVNDKDDEAEDKSYNSALLSGEGEYRGNARPIQKQINSEKKEDDPEYIPPRRMRRPMMTPIKKAVPNAEPVFLDNSVVIAARPERTIPISEEPSTEVYEPSNNIEKDIETEAAKTPSYSATAEYVSKNVASVKVPRPGKPVPVVPVAPAPVVEEVAPVAEVVAEAVETPATSYAPIEEYAPAVENVAPVIQEPVYESTVASAPSEEYASASQEPLYDNTVASAHVAPAPTVENVSTADMDSAHVDKVMKDSLADKYANEIVSPKTAFSRKSLDTIGNSDKYKTEERPQTERKAFNFATVSSFKGLDKDSEDFVEVERVITKEKVHENTDASSSPVSFSKVESFDSENIWNEVANPHENVVKKEEKEAEVIQFVKANKFVEESPNKMYSDRSEFVHDNDEFSPEKLDKEVNSKNIFKNAFRKIANTVPFAGNKNEAENVEETKTETVAETKPAPSEEKTIYGEKIISAPSKDSKTLFKVVDAIGEEPVFERVVERPEVDENAEKTVFKTMYTEPVVKVEEPVVEQIEEVAQQVEETVEQNVYESVVETTAEQFAEQYESNAVESATAEEPSQERRIANSFDYIYAQPETAEAEDNIEEVEQTAEPVEAEEYVQEEYAETYSEPETYETSEEYVQTEVSNEYEQSETSQEYAEPEYAEHHEEYAPASEYAQEYVTEQVSEEYAEPEYAEHHEEYAPASEYVEEYAQEESSQPEYQTEDSAYEPIEEYSASEDVADEYVQTAEETNDAYEPVEEYVEEETSSDNTYEESREYSNEQSSYEEELNSSHIEIVDESMKIDEFENNEVKAFSITENAAELVTEDNDSLSGINEEAASRAIVKGGSNRYHDFSSISKSEEKSGDRIVRGGSGSNDLYGESFASRTVGRKGALDHMLDDLDGGKEYELHSKPAGGIIKSESPYMMEETPKKESGRDTSSLHIVKESGTHFDFNSREQTMVNLKNNISYHQGGEEETKPVSEEKSSRDGIVKDDLSGIITSNISSGIVKEERVALTGVDSNAKPSLKHNEFHVLDNAPKTDTSYQEEPKNEPSYHEEPKPVASYHEETKPVSSYHEESIAQPSENTDRVIKSIDPSPVKPTPVVKQDYLKKEIDTSIVFKNARVIKTTKITRGIDEVPEVNKKKEEKKDKIFSDKEKVIAVIRNGEVIPVEEEKPKTKKPRKSTKKKKDESQEDMVQPPISVMLDAKEAAEMTEPLETPTKRKRGVKL